VARAADPADLSGPDRSRRGAAEDLVTDDERAVQNHDLGTRLNVSSLESVNTRRYLRNLETKGTRNTDRKFVPRASRFDRRLELLVAHTTQTRQMENGCPPIGRFRLEVSVKASYPTQCVWSPEGNRDLITRTSVIGFD
jgi:hypothetical protein